MQRSRTKTRKNLTSFIINRADIKFEIENEVLVRTVQLEIKMQLINHIEKNIFMFGLNSFDSPLITTCNMVLLIAFAKRISFLFSRQHLN